MDEKIRELAKQAGYVPIPDAGFANGLNESFHAKFTALVINECADWINNNVGMITPEARQDLLKHFGVK